MENVCSVHKTSTGHFCCTQNCVESEKRLKQNQAIDQQLIAQIERYTEANISVIMDWAESNIAFRGSSTKLFNDENFLGLIQLLGEFESAMMKHLRGIGAKEYHSKILSVNFQT